MKSLLLYPPITDPTSGYHSLCYLETYARQSGFQDIDIVDTNIESFLYTTRSDQFKKLKHKIHERLKALQDKPQLNGYEQMELGYLWKSAQFRFEQLKSAIKVMRDEELFFDYPTYRYSVELINQWLNVLSTQGYPGQFTGFSLPVRHMFNLMSSTDMSDHKMTSKIAAPFEDYFQKELLPKIAEKKYGVVGINITYCAQLPFALYISRLIRKKFPEMIILFGGTEVSDVWKYILDKDKFFNIFDVADACVVGEGEKAFVELLKLIQSRLPFHPIPNVIFHPRYELSQVEPEIQYGRIFELPTPDYQKLPWDKYLSPFRYVYYSPSRGCYWNKCTFCDYGLNFDSPTSPWRQSPVEKIIEDLKTIRETTTKYIYFSVDVLSPAMLLELSENLIGRQLDIRWGAEIRLEKYWSPERCEQLKRSGCTDISVGFESGNQRILNLINKGTQVQKIEQTMKNFSKANIGVQIMGFTGFPSESVEEALESIQFLNEHLNIWTFGGMGHFVLTPGAIVAKEPDRFGLKNVRPFENEDIPRQLYFEDQNVKWTEEDHNRIKQAKSKISKNHMNRPWVGGVDTAHTMFYHDKFGSEIIDVIQSSTKQEYNNKFYQLNGMILEDIPGYSLLDLFQDLDLMRLHNEANENATGLLGDQIQEKLNEIIAVRQTNISQTLYFMRTDGTFFPFPQEMISFLKRFENGLSWSLIASHAKENELQMYERLFKHCIAHHFIHPVCSFNLQTNERDFVTAYE